MAATYQEALPRELDRVRVMVGDTDVSDALLSDEHIVAVLALTGGIPAAIVFLLDELIARFSHDPSKIERGGLVLDWTKRLDRWIALRNRQQAQIDAAAPTSIWSMVPRSLGDAVATDEYSDA